ncbi:MAG: type I-B CRISPR-associated protein Cas7/Cst2/DevR [Pleurocapsa sp.]
MTFHLYGNILTFYGVAANNRGENQGNITTLQKLIWKGETHTVVSSEAIRWAIRYYWQQAGISVNRRWNDDPQPNEENPRWQNPNFDRENYIDDDLLGFFDAEGDVRARRGRLDVTRAISTIPYNGKVTFSAKSGNIRTNTSLYGTEFHGTRYQFGFGITPESCQDKSRVLDLLDALVSICRVGGNHGRFLFDFAPESIILRWTKDFAPRFLYCFEEDEMGDISMPKLLRQIRSGDLDPTEFWIGGEITEFLQGTEYEGINRFSGVKETVDALKEKITEDLLFCPINSNNTEEN